MLRAMSKGRPRTCVRLCQQQPWQALGRRLFSADGKGFPNALRFDLSAAEIAKTSHEVMESYKKGYGRMVSVPSRERNFQNTLQGIADLDAYCSAVSESCVFPSYVSVRDAAGAANKALSELAIETAMREDIFKAFTEYYNHTMPQETLTPVQRRLIEKTMHDFKKNGLMLSPEKREQLKAMRKKMSDNAITFQKNLNEDTTAFYFSREELDGLPQDFLDGLEKVDGQEGGATKYKVSLRYPELLPVMRYANNAETRRKLDTANAARSMRENTPLLEETLALRHEAALLLGYEDHASYVLEDRMAKNPAHVLDFINELSVKVEPLARREWEKMIALKKATVGGSDNVTIDSHDFTFYNQRILERDYQVDENLIKDYFPFETVTEGMLGVYQDILGLRFEELNDAHTWHRDVRMYAVYDRSTNAFMGQFYLDLWPREGKYPHAAVFPLVPSHHFPSGSSSDIPASFLAHLHPVTGNACSPFARVIMVPRKLTRR
ncbi:peptidase family M3 protein [Acanthamoeba castellanii str. Neff]|uniref:Peptidase family M3 protein n=1 Tax=Acanthamoeba castellanii (strain ATCC 30010 / Neff) TaxID=1257118 RepID=L8GZK9_ACACF|nr:peptidase family M3 protein [Acanthamoeba castellanii str. Neff]ELR17536.1 peptidase family M3 protein [Acanthamoeba castellanii str. Neff]